MSWKFCKNHTTTTYAMNIVNRAIRFKVQDCPYCEIDRLKGELEGYKKHEDFTPPITCSDNCNLIRTLERQLSEARVEVVDHKLKVMALSNSEADALVDLRLEKQQNSTISGQLAEARAEIERLIKEVIKQRTRAEIFQLSMLSEARQQAAGEIVKMLNGAEFEGPNAHKFSQVRNHFVGQIMNTFGLEG
jgi:hypothetical protein